MKKVKLVIFVPTTHADLVRQAMGDTGAGVIGNYSHNTVSMKVTSRYKPLEGANPTIGEVGKFETVEEERIETLCERERVKDVIEAIKKVHPYEQVAIDIYPLVDEEEI